MAIALPVSVRLRRLRRLRGLRGLRRLRGPFFGVVAFASISAALGACASLKQADLAALPLEGGSASDGPTPLDGSIGVEDAHDSGATDAFADVLADADASTGPSGLDRGVVLPNLGEPPCSDPGNPTVCGGVRACRMATPDSGRCDDCNPPGLCSALVTQVCVNSLDCDVDLQCFRGRCTLFCTLPTGPECGRPNNCIDVGYVSKGLCDPAKL